MEDERDEDDPLTLLETRESMCTPRLDPVKFQCHLPSLSLGISDHNISSPPIHLPSHLPPLPQISSSRTTAPSQSSTSNSGPTIECLWEGMNLQGQVVEDFITWMKDRKLFPISLEQTFSHLAYSGYDIDEAKKSFLQESSKVSTFEYPPFIRDRYSREYRSLIYKCLQGKKNVSMTILSHIIKQSESGNKQVLRGLETAAKIWISYVQKILKQTRIMSENDLKQLLYLAHTILPFITTPEKDELERIQSDILEWRKNVIEMMSHDESLSSLFIASLIKIANSKFHNIKINEKLYLESALIYNKKICDIVAHKLMCNRRTRKNYQESKLPLAVAEKWVSRGNNYKFLQSPELKILSNEVKLSIDWSKRVKNKLSDNLSFTFETKSSSLHPLPTKYIKDLETLFTESQKLHLSTPESDSIRTHLQAFYWAKQVDKALEISSGPTIENLQSLYNDAEYYCLVDSSDSYIKERSLYLRSTISKAMSWLVNLHDYENAEQSPTLETLKSLLIESKTIPVRISDTKRITLIIERTNNWVENSYKILSTSNPINLTEIEELLNQANSIIYPLAHVPGSALQEINMLVTIGKHWIKRVINLFTGKILRMSDMKPLLQETIDNSALKRLNLPLIDKLKSSIQETQEILDKAEQTLTSEFSLTELKNIVQVLSLNQIHSNTKTINSKTRNPPSLYTTLSIRVKTSEDWLAMARKSIPSAKYEDIETIDNETDFTLFFSVILKYPSLKRIHSLIQSKKENSILTYVSIPEYYILLDVEEKVIIWQKKAQLLLSRNPDLPELYSLLQDYINIPQVRIPELQQVQNRTFALDWVLQANKILSSPTTIEIISSLHSQLFKFSFPESLLLEHKQIILSVEYLLSQTIFWINRTRKIFENAIGIYRTQYLFGKSLDIEFERYLNDEEYDNLNIKKNFNIFNSTDNKHQDENENDQEMTKFNIISIYNDVTKMKKHVDDDSQLIDNNELNNSEGNKIEPIINKESINLENNDTIIIPQPTVTETDNVDNNELNNSEGNKKSINLNLENNDTIIIPQPTVTVDTQRRSSRKRVPTKIEDESTQPSNATPNNTFNTNEDPNNTIVDFSPYCVCLQPHIHGEHMVGCDNCNDWFHLSCLGLTRNEITRTTKFLCPSCSKKLGKSDFCRNIPPSRKYPSRGPRIEIIESLLSQCPDSRCTSRETIKCREIISLARNWINNTSSLIDQLATDRLENYNKDRNTNENDNLNISENINEENDLHNNNKNEKFSKNEEDNSNTYNTNKRKQDQYNENISKNYKSTVEDESDEDYDTTEEDSFPPKDEISFLQDIFRKSLSIPLTFELRQTLSDRIRSLIFIESLFRIRRRHSTSKEIHSAYKDLSQMTEDLRCDNKVLKFMEWFHIIQEWEKRVSLVLSEKTPLSYLTLLSKEAQELFPLMTSDIRINLESRVDEGRKWGLKLKKAFALGLRYSQFIDLITQRETSSAKYVSSQLLDNLDCELQKAENWASRLKTAIKEEADIDVFKNLLKDVDKKENPVLVDIRDLHLCQQLSKRYCLCQSTFSSETTMIGCDKCDDWFHEKCVNLTEAEAQSIPTFICPRCAFSLRIPYSHGSYVPDRKGIHKDRLLELDKLRNQKETTDNEKKQWRNCECQIPVSVFLVHVHSFLLTYIPSIGNASQITLWKTLEEFLVLYSREMNLPIGLVDEILKQLQDRQLVNPESIMALRFNLERIYYEISTKVQQHHQTYHYIAFEQYKKEQLKKDEQANIHSSIDKQPQKIENIENDIDETIDKININEDITSNSLSHHPNCKKPLTPYRCFVRDFRNDPEKVAYALSIIKDQKRDEVIDEKTKTPRQLRQIPIKFLVDAWRVLPPDKRRPYKEMARIDRQRYEEELKVLQTNTQEDMYSTDNSSSRTPLIALARSLTWDQIIEQNIPVTLRQSTQQKKLSDNKISNLSSNKKKEKDNDDTFNMPRLQENNEKLQLNSDSDQIQKEELSTNIPIDPTLDYIKMSLQQSGSKLKRKGQDSNIIPNKRIKSVLSNSKSVNLKQKQYSYFGVRFLIQKCDIHSIRIHRKLLLRKILPADHPKILERYNLFQNEMSNVSDQKSPENTLSVMNNMNTESTVVNHESNSLIDENRIPNTESTVVNHESNSLIDENRIPNTESTVVNHESNSLIDENMTNLTTSINNNNMIRVTNENIINNTKLPNDNITNDNFSNDNMTSVTNENITSVTNDNMTNLTNDSEKKQF